MQAIRGILCIVVIVVIGVAIIWAAIASLAIPIYVPAPGADTVWYIVIGLAVTILSYCCWRAARQRR